MQYGLSVVDELKLIEVAVEEATNSAVSVLLIPGIGTKADLQAVAGIGAKMVRVATHVTEADVANKVIAPLMQQSQEITGSGLVLGYADVYSSFLLHAEKAAKQFGVDERDILMELGRQKTVGGQEDLIYEVAQQLVK